MILGLTIAAALGFVLAALFAYFLGRDKLAAMRAIRERDAAIAEREFVHEEHERCYQGAMELSDKIASLESERLKALEKIGQQARAIETYSALQETSHHRIDELTGRIDECNVVLDLKENQIAELTKEIQQWKAANESNRNDLDRLRLHSDRMNDFVKQISALLAKATV